MPLKYPWAIVGERIPVIGVENILDSMKSYRAYTTKWTRCTICSSNIGNHPMRYRIVMCNSSACGGDCEWYFKVEMCSSDNLATLYLHGAHNSAASSPRQKMRLSDERYIAERTEQHVRPARIQNELIQRNPDRPATELPKLSQVQRFSYNYKKTRMLEDALVETMNRLVGLNSSAEELPTRSTEPFAFGFSVDATGQPSVGNGGDDQPMQVGITTTAMLGRLTSAAELTLHVDATFKLNQSGFPVIIFGVSDLVRSFHPVASFITSRLMTSMFERALNSLFDAYERHVGHPPEIKLIMSDADDARFNAVSNVCEERDLPRPQHLMCFFHVMMNVKKHTRNLSKAERCLVKDIIYDMNFAANEEEYKTVCLIAAERWSSSNELKTFATYFKKVWVDSRFNKWQCFRSPMGSAKTNNPIEQFNRAIKREYTLGLLVPMNALFDQLLVMSRSKSTLQKPPIVHCQPVDDMRRRVKYLEKAGLITVATQQRGSLSFLLRGNPNVFIVKQSRVIDPNVPRPRKKAGLLRFFGSTNLRQAQFEIRDQPVDGWRVDVVQRTCPCKILFKLGFCPHLVVGMTAAGMDLPGFEKPQMFVNRRINTGSTQGGRPPNVGAALSTV